MRFDYIIVGAGSAGCVLANRLTEDGKTSVCIIEAGGSDRRFWIQTPLGYGKIFFDKSVNWAYETLQEPALNGRKSYWPRGKVLGGSSSINAMVYIRGQHADYDDWAALGNEGWGAADVLSYFRKSETNSRGADEWRGGDGPLYVSDVSDRYHPVNQHFLDAAVECGINRNRDFNGADQEGVGEYQITAKDGFRMSAAKAYLHPAVKRGNVNTETNAHVTRILFEQSRAVGVEFVKGGSIRHIHANREVIVCGGAINSPQLLMLSGIGDADKLRSMGIEVVKNAPAVGKNLQDHLAISHYYRSKVPTLNNQLAPWWGKVMAGMQYILFRTGPLSIGVNQAGGFFRSSPARSRPNLQFYFAPVTYKTAPVGQRPLIRPDPFAAFLNCICQCRPTSRGEINIQSTNPLDPVAIQPKYLSTEEDVQEMVEGFRFMRKMASSPALQSVIEREFTPGDSVQTEEDIIDYIRQTADTVYHPTSTCIMGPDECSSVVNNQCKVYGIENLRVVDASVFPTVTSGNTNAPVIMVAEKVADMMKNEKK